jgi:urease accessory protein
MQLADSFFPSGMFSMSGGLESLVIHKKITNWEQVLNFIKEQIEFQLVPSDCVVLSITIDGVKNFDLEKVVHIDNKYYSMKLAKEVRNSSVRSGKQVFHCLKHMIGENKNKFLKQFDSKIESKETPCTYPVALGITAVCLELPIQSIMRIFLYSFSSSVVSAAIRLGVIQHLDAQKILLLLAKHVNNIILNLTQKKTTKDIWQLTPLTEIHQMKHEHNESRMFIT